MDEAMVVNLTDKPLNQFKDGDSLYIQKTESGFSVNLLCAFRGLLGGNTVIATVIHTYRAEYAGRWNLRRTSTVARKCFLWGATEGEDRPRCHWFQNAKTKAK